MPPIDAARILDDELRGSDAVTRAYARENARLRRLVVALCAEVIALRARRVETVVVPPAPAYDPATVAFNSADATVDVSDSDSLYRNVLGALKMCIKAHGPISFGYIESAAKRVVGAVRVHNHNIGQSSQ